MFWANFYNSFWTYAYIHRHSHKLYSESNFLFIRSQFLYHYRFSIFVFVCYPRFFFFSFSPVFIVLLLLSDIIVYESLIIETSSNGGDSCQQQEIQHLDTYEKIIHLEPITAIPSSNEFVSYQRFGRVNKEQSTFPFKCHLCGFSCRYKQSLLDHFQQNHPN